MGLRNLILGADSLNTIFLAVPTAETAYIDSIEFGLESRINPFTDPVVWRLSIERECTFSYQLF